LERDDLKIFPLGQTSEGTEKKIINENRDHFDVVNYGHTAQGSNFVPAAQLW
jgi:hypothetical protein